MILLKPDFFAIKAMRQGHVLITAEESKVLKDIRKSKDYDEPVVKAIEELKRSPMKTLCTNEWQEEQGLFLF